MDQQQLNRFRMMRKLKTLIAEAENLGLNLEIRTVSLKPVAMGNTIMQPWVWPARHMQTSGVVSETFYMNTAQRILHVGGRNREGSTYVEFGSIQAVQALIHHAARDSWLP